MNRRDFFKKSSLGLLGGGLLGRSALSGPGETGETELKIKGYRTLGRTGFRVSDIGAGDFNDPGPFRGLLDAGVNYIDTSETYGQHARKIGDSIQGRDRGSLFITCKLQADTSSRRIAAIGIDKAGFLRRFHEMTEAMQLDYLDCLMLSSPETLEDLECEGFHAAIDELKKAGKVHFVGVSHHGSQWFLNKPKVPMDKILTAAAEDGRFDVMLLAYNFLKQDGSERLLELCGKKKIGVTLMKTNPIRSYTNNMQQYLERKENRREELTATDRENIERMEKKLEDAQDFIRRHNLKSEGEIREAAVKFVLSNPHVHTVCATVLNYDEMRSFIRLSGTRLKGRDEELLAVYRRECGGLYCRHACGLCEPACPHEVPVNTILRYDHYFVAQSREKHAMTKYAELKDHSAAICQDCAGYCESACPYGVPARALLTAAHLNLSLT